MQKTGAGRANALYTPREYPRRGGVPALRLDRGRCPFLPAILRPSGCGMTGACACLKPCGLSFVRWRSSVLLMRTSCRSPARNTCPAIGPAFPPKPLVAPTACRGNRTEGPVLGAASSPGSKPVGLGVGQIRGVPASMALGPAGSLARRFGLLPHRHVPGPGCPGPSVGGPGLSATLRAPAHCP